jgi:ABC-2 type transport system permease protein
MLPIIFVMPIIQILVLSYAATFEVKNIRIGFIDNDKSVDSRDFINRFNASSLFILTDLFQNSDQAIVAIQKGEIDVFIEIPVNFEKKMIQDEQVDLSVQIDAINGSAAGVINGYVGQIVKRFGDDLRRNISTHYIVNSNFKRFEIVPSYWYNPELDYKIFMVPGIIVILVTMISFFLSGMNIVREKEIGTLEQINVTPIKKYQFIIGKLLPFWILGMFILFFAMNIGRFVFAVPVLGNPLVILAFASIYILLFLGMGFFVSNFTETQQQAMFIAYFFMVIFHLDEWLVYPYRKHAGLGSKNNRIQSGAVLH